MYRSASITRPSGRLGVVALGLAVIALLALGAGPASASKGVASFFGGTGTEGGKFEFPGKSLAINQTGAGGVSPGDVYVVDHGNNRVQEFSASGAFVRAFGMNVGGPGVDVCQVASACAAGAASSAAASVSLPSGVAVDQQTGDVYVTSTGASNLNGEMANNRIDVFSAAGSFLGAFGWSVNASSPAEELQFCTLATGCKRGSAGAGAGQLGGPITSGPRETTPSEDRIAISPLNGDVIVADEGNERINEYAPTFEAGVLDGATLVRSIGPVRAKDVAVAAAGTIYAVADHQIQIFDASGAPTGVIEPEPEARFEHLAVNAQTGELVTSFSGLGAEEGKTEWFIGLYEPSGELKETYSLGQFPPTGVAEDESTATIYLGVPLYLQVQNVTEFGVAIFGEIVPPRASIDPAANITGTSATFSGHVDPEGFQTAYKFEYSADGSHWIVATSGELPSDSAEHAVEGEATGLEALTTYHLRIVASKLLNSGTASAETDFETTSAPPIVSAPHAAAVSDSGARLEGAVNPENEPTEYHFECVAEAEFLESGYARSFQLPPGGGSLPAVGRAVPVVQSASSLAAATEYHCRLTANNDAGGVTGQESIFTTYRSQPFFLPDGRAFEQATPLAKNASGANGVEYLLRAAPDGSAISYFIAGGGAIGGGGQELPTYVATRGSTAWTSYPYLPLSSYGEHAKVLGWSRDMRTDYVLAWNSGGRATLYEQDVPSGALLEIAGNLEPGKGTAFAAESEGEGEALFESTGALAGEAVAGASNLYVWNRDAHTLTWIDELPEESAPPGGAFLGPYFWPAKSFKTGGSEASIFTQDLHAFSSDGSKAFFTTSNVNQIYAREGIGTVAEDTVQVSASHKTNGAGPGGRDPSGPKKAAFLEATPDGRYVFFTSPEELTNDATTGTADQGNDLYRFDTDTGELIDIAPDPSDPDGAVVQGVLGSSADGSYVYFAANGALAGSAAAGDCESGPTTGFNVANERTCNIYVWHEGQIAFVAPTGGKVTDGALNWSASSSYGSGLAMKTARVSEEGGTLAFMSTLSPTSYDSEGDNEVYLYRPGAGLDCISCNPTGAPPVASASLQDIFAEFGPTGPNAFMSHNLNAAGTRMFFETPDKLVSGDTNGDEGCPSNNEFRGGRACQNVYEWEADGTGSCQSGAQSGGCLYLISPGDAAGPAFFADASENGDDAFFFTTQSLVGSDTDQLMDVYDARVGGGLPGQNESPSAPCEGEGEGCRGPATRAPGPESVGTSSFSGPGNPRLATQCKKGYTRKHGKCVKKSKHKKKHAKKKHGKRNSKAKDHQKKKPVKAKRKGGH